MRKERNRACPIKVIQVPYTRVFGVSSALGLYVSRNTTTATAPLIPVRTPIAHNNARNPIQSANTPPMSGPIRDPAAVALCSIPSTFPRSSFGASELA